MTLPSTHAYSQRITLSRSSYDEAMIQPSSIDFRLDKFFRVFDNHKYPHIDPAADQSDLTREVEPEGDDPFILHPGEFVLGSTYEVVSLPDDIADLPGGADHADPQALPLTVGAHRPVPP